MKRPVAVRGVAISPVSTKIGVEPFYLIQRYNCQDAGKMIKCT